MCDKNAYYVKTKSFLNMIKNILNYKPLFYFNSQPGPKLWQILGDKTWNEVLFFRVLFSRNVILRQVDRNAVQRDQVSKSVSTEIGLSILYPLLCIRGILVVPEHIAQENSLGKVSVIMKCTVPWMVFDETQIEFLF